MTAPLPRQPRILILGLPLGGGHMAIARSIRQHLHAAAPDTFDIQVDELSNGVLVAGRAMSTPSSQFYRHSVGTLGGWPYRALYRYADRNPDRIVAAADRLFGARASGWLNDRRPDLVIATHPLVASLAANAFRDRTVGIVAVVSDAGRVNRLWWATRPHLLLVSHRDLVEQAYAAGMAQGSVHDVGLIVNPILAGAIDPAEPRRTLTVLLCAGGLGFGPHLARLARRLGHVDGIGGVRFFVATGSNAALRMSVVAGLRPAVAHECPALDMSEALLAADLVVGKAGWMTMSECITAGKPIIIVDLVPGQEEENARFIESLGVGRLMTVDSTVRAITRYIGDPELLSREFTTRRDLYHQHLGTHLVDLIAELLRDLRGA